MTNLKSVWDQLTSNYSRNKILAEDHWAEIENTYSAPHRHYHNLSHLSSVIEMAKEYQENITDPDILMFSIFYHDFIYNPGGKDNEQQSAKIAMERLCKLMVPEDKIKKCSSQIIATKDHLDNDDNDIKFLLDFDLAILGSSPLVYRNYTIEIRKEFSMYPDLLYRKGREKVLQHFLNINRIFKSNQFFNSREQQARTNLSKELEDIKKLL